MNRKIKKTIRKPTKRMKRDNRTTSFFFTNRTKAHGSLMENQEELMELLLRGGNVFADEGHWVVIFQQHGKAGVGVGAL